MTALLWLSLKSQSDQSGVEMRLFAKTVVIGFLSLSSAIQAQSIVLEGVNLVPMTSEKVIHNQRVWIERGTISRIESMDNPAGQKADLYIDGRGKFLIPALSDTHFHQHRNSIEDTKLLFKLLIANGVGTVRTMAQWNEQDTIAIRQWAAQADTIAPHYYASGPQLNATNVKNVADAVAMVDMHQQRGYDFIKVHGNLEPQAYLALLERAAFYKLPVTGHAQRHLPLQYTLRMHSLAHIEELVVLLAGQQLQIPKVTPLELNDMVQQIKTSGITVTPTLSILALIPEYTDEKRYLALQKKYESQFIAYGEYLWFTNPDNPSYQSAFFKTPQMKKYIADMIQTSARLTKALSDAGVPLLVGSDNLGFHIAGFSVHEEMQQMQKAGMTPYQVLKAATADSARYLGRQALAGTLEVGKNAEFVLLAANPLLDISHTKRIEGVMHKGRWYNRAALDQLLSDVAQARQAEKTQPQ